MRACNRVIIPDYTEVVIPENYAAHVNSIEMGVNSVIVIEEGGELYHNDLVELIVGMNYDGYGVEAKDNDIDGYRLIASPVYTDVNWNSCPVIGTNLNTGVFDLYRFDQNSVHAEWINYKQGEGNNPGFTDLYLGEGYLYANEDNQDIIFNGIALPTTADHASSSQMEYSNDAILKGWNLLGNPFTCKATVSGVNDFYVMNAEGSDFVAVSADTAAVNPMQGIFVQVTEPNQNVTFTPGVPTGNRDTKLNLRVNGCNDDYDLARIRFGQGQHLEKFMLNENHTKIYFPVDNKCYAVAYAEEKGEMPVNFKAEYNGIYTMSFISEEVSFNYLHLIDNMTGADVDLLAANDGVSTGSTTTGSTTSYTFEAKTTDYANRFKLVFSTNNEGGPSTSSGTFAFINSGNIIINGEGTVQVIDMMGHVLVCTDAINRISTSEFAPGVYVLRLINGDNVETQKIVIE